MNIEQEKNVVMNHSISIVERQNISISGVTKIDSFDSEEFLLETTAGNIGIKGRELEIVKLDTFEGTIMIKGIIDAFTYFDEGKKKKEDNMLTRLFK